MAARPSLASKHRMGFARREACVRLAARPARLLVLLTLLFTFLGTDSPASAGTADWRGFHFDARNNRYNPLETVLSPTTVPGLRKLWSFHTLSSVYSSPAVVDGVVYVGSL